MITLKTTKWGDMFSYGPDNCIDLHAEKLTQLVGINGSGKTSIPLIIEEILTNTNSKGIKKGDILNRYSNASFYWGSQDFSIDGDEYNVYIKRGTTQTVKLTKNGVDISMHTATETYKVIKELLKNISGRFPQLIAQQSSNSLEFLSATDSTRKKFLIELMGLDYDKYYEHFKDLHKLEANTLIALKSKEDTIQAWINKYSQPFETKPIVDVPTIPQDIKNRISEISIQLKNIRSINQSISKNNQYKSMLDNFDMSPLYEIIPENVNTDTTSINRELGVARSEQQTAEAMIKKLGSIGLSCPTCLQAVDVDFIAKLRSEATIKIAECSTIMQSLQAELAERTKMQQKISKRQHTQQEFEKLQQLYNPALPNELADQSALTSELMKLENGISSLEQSISIAIKNNQEAASHNSKIETITQQLQEYSVELKELKELVSNKNKLTEALDIIKKVFGTNGFITYKLENLLVDLEDITNEYLSTMSSGRFQLTFKVVGEKLNVFIIDNGKTISIEALSSGEKARVNTATLLAIRRLMSTLSSTKINLLVLDETIDTLDAQGKEQLIEILLEEPELNTFIVSHGFTHPLLHKIHVIKENNISRLE